MRVFSKAFVISVLTTQLLYSGTVELHKPVRGFNLFKAEYSLEQSVDPLLNEQWYLLNGIELLSALEIFKPQKEVIVAVIDSGLDLNHEDIGYGSVWKNFGEIGEGRETNGVDDDGNGYIDDVNGWNFITNSPEVDDDMYHGTHVSGLIAATSFNGVGILAGNPAIKVMPLKIFSNTTGTASTKEVARAVRYAVDNGASIISNSYGTPSYSKVMHEAIKYARDNKVLFVVAAGNSRHNLESKPIYPASYGVENEIVVAASGENNLFSNFSNYGNTVDIVAPGTRILSLYPGSLYRAYSGTSQACPMVSYALALAMSHNPHKGYMEIKELVLQGADQYENLEKWVGRAGRVNVYNGVAGKNGARVKSADLAKWNTKDVQVESSHPYPNSSVKDYEISIPGSLEMVLHFEKLAISFDDDLEIYDEKGTLLEVLNSYFDKVNSVTIPGSKAILRLISRGYVRDYGFKVSKVFFRYK